MNNKALSLFFKMEENRKSLFQFLSEYDAEKYNECLNGAWSVNQNIQHLLMSEAGTVQYMNKKMLAGDDLENTGIKNKWNWFILKVAFNMPFKYKVPKIVDPKGETIQYNELMKDWEETRHRLQEFINNYPDKFRNKNIFKHPFAGRANLDMTMDFLDFHSSRHFNQIKRTIKKI